MAMAFGNVLEGVPRLTIKASDFASSMAMPNSIAPQNTASVATISLEIQGMTNDAPIIFSGGDIEHPDQAHTLDPVTVHGGTEMPPSPARHDPPTCDPPSVPEPATEALILLGIAAGIVVWLVRRIRKDEP